MVVHMRHTRAHTANRRSHHALKSKSFSVCSNCKALFVPHRACEACGMYKGRVIIDVVKKVAKKDAKLKAKKG